jgi:DNA-directed RNA polymerase subunit RPC12/RpoP
LSYKCKDCKKEFQIPKTAYEDRSPWGGGDESFIEVFYVCPHCESPYFGIKGIKYDFEEEEKDI